MFILSQHIFHYIQLHVQMTSCSVTKPCNINQLIKKYSKDNSSRNHSINFCKAVYILHYFCMIFDIHDSVRFIHEMEEIFISSEFKQMAPEVLEVVSQIDHVNVLQHEGVFECVCKDLQVTAKICEKCMCQFHPDCQYQKIICNKCFITHYFQPLDSKFFSKFGERTRTQTYFHSKFQVTNQSEYKKIKFFFAKFDVPNSRSLTNVVEPQFYIKIMNFKNQANISILSDRWKSLNRQNGQFYFALNLQKVQVYLNFSHIRKKYEYFRSENSLIIKLENRFTTEKNNILMLQFQVEPFQNQHYQIVVCHTIKIVQKPTNNNVLEQTNQPKVRITLQQYNILQKYSKKISDPNHIPKDQNKIEPTLPDEQKSSNEIQKNKATIYQKVRSYGCNHAEGINLKDLKEKHMLYLQSLKSSNQKKDKKISKKNNYKNRFKKQNLSQFKEKEEKKLKKFVKCPLCTNYLMVLYLLPCQFIQGEQIKVKAYKKKKIAQDDEMPKQSICQFQELDHKNQHFGGQNSKVLQSKKDFFQDFTKQSCVIAEGIQKSQNESKSIEIQVISEKIYFCQPFYKKPQQESGQLIEKDIGHSSYIVLQDQQQEGQLRLYDQIKF